VEYHHHLIKMPFVLVMIQLRYGSIGIKQQSLTHSKQEVVRTYLIRLTQPMDNSFGEVVPRVRTCHGDPVDGLPHNTMLLLQ
jgi:hypothetical protein